MTLLTDIGDYWASWYGVPQPVFRAVINTESRWNPSARGSAGEVGLGQLLPSTAASLGVDPYDPNQNLQGAAKYLSQLYNTPGIGTWANAVVAYNRGPGGFARNPSPTQQYQLTYALAGTYDPGGSITMTPIPPNADLRPACQPNDLRGWLSGRCSPSMSPSAGAFSANPISGITDAIRFITSPDNWTRLAIVLVGIGVLIAGLFLLGLTGVANVRLANTGPAGSLRRRPSAVG